MPFRKEVSIAEDPSVTVWLSKLEAEMRQTLALQHEEALQVRNCFCTNTDLFAPVIMCAAGVVVTSTPPTRRPRVRFPGCATFSVSAVFSSEAKREVKRADVRTSGGMAIGATVAARAGPGVEAWMEQTNDPLLQGPIPKPKGSRINLRSQYSPREPLK